MTAHKSWRHPTDAEFPHGIAELGKIVGEEEAIKPTWTRRLALSEAGEWLLTVDGACELQKYTMVWDDPNALTVLRLAYTLAEGVKILQGPNNPEEVLRQRREACKAHEAEQAADKAEEQAERQRRDAEQKQRVEDERNFNADGWHKMDPWVQAFFALAVRVQSRDPELAADLRAIAHEGRRKHPAVPSFPCCRWDEP